MSNLHSHNHKRVSTYKVSMNEMYNHHFLINPDYIHEDELLFIYRENNKEVQKKVQVRDIIKHFKVMKFFKEDPETLRSKYNGYAYEIPADVIFTY